MVDSRRTDKDRGASESALKKKSEQTKEIEQEQSKET